VALSPQAPDAEEMMRDIVQKIEARDIKVETTNLMSWDLPLTDSPEYSIPAEEIVDIDEDLLIDMLTSPVEVVVPEKFSPEDIFNISCKLNRIKWISLCLMSTEEEWSFSQLWIVLPNNASSNKFLGAYLNKVDLFVATATICDLVVGVADTLGVVKPSYDIVHSLCFSSVQFVMDGKDEDKDMTYGPWIYFLSDPSFFLSGEGMKETLASVNSEAQVFSEMTGENFVRDLSKLLDAGGCWTPDAAETWLSTTNQQVVE
jgi:hypothetical protein